MKQRRSSSLLPQQSGVESRINKKDFRWSTSLSQYEAFPFSGEQQSLNDSKISSFQLVLLFALALKALADPFPTPNAVAEPHHGIGYGGYGLGGRYGYFGYGKRSAEPHHQYYGGYGQKGYRYYGYGKRSVGQDIIGPLA